MYLLTNKRTKYFFRHIRHIHLTPRQVNCKKLLQITTELLLLSFWTDNECDTNHFGYKCNPTKTVVAMWLVLIARFVPNLWTRIGAKQLVMVAIA